MRKKGFIEIVLQSDLCMGSGYSYAGVIDSDICYDACGIPYIPARRLKGCFRKAAEELLYSIFSEKEIAAIFGTTGANATKGILLDNAYPEGYEVLRKDLELLFQKFPDNFGPQEVLEQFTRVKAQTRLQDGVAEDLSLRFTRVLNQYALGNGCMKFKAEVFFEDDETDTLEKQLRKIVKATKNIGLMRNRGLGSVRCELRDVACCRNSEKNTMQVDEHMEYVINYIFTNKEPLMLSGKGDDCSEKYISGQKVLGFLAKKYLEQKGHTPEDEAFIDLFLNGRTKFTHAYPYRDGIRYCPAPEHINRLKKTKKLVNSYFSYNEKTDDTSYNPEQGNQPKKLKGKFTASKGNQMAETDVEMFIIYHHSQKGESRGGKKGILYSTEVIKERQTFSGSIYVPGKYAAAVLDLLTSGELRFGKSLTAQYGKCMLTEQPTCEPVKSESLQFCAGTEILVRFLSDTILIDEDMKEYSVYSDSVMKIVAEQLGIAEKIEASQYTPMLRTKILRGYQSAWNLRKLMIPAIEAGSCLVYRLKENVEIPRTFLGERNQEGFGEICVEVLSGQQYVVMEADESETDQKDIAEHIKNEMTRQIIQKVAVDSMLNTILLQTMSEKELQVSKSVLGRVTLMLHESLEKNKNNSLAAFQEFVKRVQSIKRKAVREEIEKNILKKIADCTEKKEAEKKVEIWTLRALPGFSDLKQQKEMLALIGWDEEQCRHELNKEWGTFLLFILVQQKYMK